MIRFQISYGTLSFGTRAWPDSTVISPVAVNGSVDIFDVVRGEGVAFRFLGGYADVLTREAVGSEPTLPFGRVLLFELRFGMLFHGAR